MWVPLLRQFPSQTWFIVDGIVAGLVFFFIATLILAVLPSKNVHDRIEKQLKKRSKSSKKHRAGIAKEA
jgi:hypothetical protein